MAANVSSDDAHDDKSDLKLRASGYDFRFWTEELVAECPSAYQVYTVQEDHVQHCTSHQLLLARGPPVLIE
jgi:hypothetical protein